MYLSLFLFWVGGGVELRLTSDFGIKKLVVHVVNLKWAIFLQLTMVRITICITGNFHQSHYAYHFIVLLKYKIFFYCKNNHHYCIYRILTVHGSADQVIPVQDALEFAKIIPNHKLHVVEGADHGYTSHQAELVSVVLNFIKEALQQDKVTLCPPAV